MPAWVIRKTLPAHDYGLGLNGSRSGGHGGALGSNPVFLYWARPATSHPRSTSWVWVSGLCPKVHVFPTRAAAEAAAQALAGPRWRSPDLYAVTLDSSEIRVVSGFTARGDLVPGDGPDGDPRIEAVQR